MKKTKEKKATETGITETSANIEMGDVVMLSLNDLKASETNPRKNFAAAGMKDLTASIKDKGIIQPLLVRKVCVVGKSNADHEIICGERRYRAAKELGLEYIPCIVCHMSDSQVVEVQVVENMQRADLSALEEATGYMRLREEFKMDWPEIAARVGKSQQYVFRRLNLLNLIPEFLKLLAAGKLPVSWAEEIIKIENPEDQLAFYKKYDFENNIEFLNYEDNIVYGIESTYLLKLAEAPFPVRDTSLAGGACGNCTKRTGAQPDLFGDLVGKNDTCRDPKCWAAKKKEHEKKALDKCADLIKAGHKILVGAKAEQALQGYVYNKPGDTSYLIKGNMTWKQALTGTGYKNVIAIDASGNKHELISPKEAAAFIPAKYKVKGNMPEKPQSEEDKALEKMKEEAERAAEVEIISQIIELAKKKSLEDVEVLRVVAPGLIKRYPMHRIGEAFKYRKFGKNPGDKESLKRYIWMSAYDNESKDVLKFFGLDKELKALEKTKLAELKAAAGKQQKGKSNENKRK